MATTIRVNGEEEAFTAGTLADLLRRKGVDPAARGAAVAVNGAVVPRANWSAAALEPGDTVEIVRPFPGG